MSTFAGVSISAGPIGNAKAHVVPPRIVLDPISSLVVANTIVAFINTLPDTHCTIAGGFPRDIYLGNAPRDIDIIVAQQGYKEFSLDILFKIEQFLKTLGNVETHLDYDDSQAKNEAISVCFKIPELCIDIILFSRGYDTFQSVIQSFDANINMFILDSVDGQVKFLGQNQGTLEFSNYPMCTPAPYRMNKILKLAQAAGW
ncbi:MAG: hypothetical protein HRU18_02990 [Pseudoalteromonas sp.]|uniref:hypothetical protein n=1 Tax=Pseudoalteromonas sp. TaxID=53249 RepID=UPI001D81010B|nr:hypothetical protein [Pseudoalteromonas sp.]NRA77151.1 hypothetical protein [Pseudoalteromonas sp.]